MAGPQAGDRMAAYIPGRSEMSAVLSIRSLGKSFGHLNVLNGIDLEVAEGEVIAIIGASGSGKSRTSSKAICVCYVICNSIVRNCAFKYLKGSLTRACSWFVIRLF